mgnify:CR=1 FL=1
MTTKIKLTIKKNIPKIVDEPTLEEIAVLLDTFIEYGKHIETLKQKYKHFRMPNFPDEISENIVKFIIQNKTGLTPMWRSCSGDLEHNNRKVEVKCFTSLGPSSFGPTERWDEIYFLDATDYMKKNFKCYKVNMSNVEFGNIHINRTQLYSDQCSQGRRPRISFGLIYKQLEKEKVEIIFDANMDKITDR